MKANRAARPAHDDAVSSVVAAVLLVALFTTVFLTYTVTTLPDWIKDNEREHQRVVKERMDSLKGGLEALSATGSTGAVSAAIPLSAAKVALLQQDASTGDLSYLTGFRSQLAFGASPSMYLAGGQLVAAPTDSTASLSPAPTTLTALVVAITTSGVSGATDFASYTVTVKDSSATPQTYTATLKHAGSGVAPNLGCTARHIRLSVDLGLGARDSLLSCGVDTAIPTAFQVDLMALPFGPAVRSMQAPLTVTFATAVSGAATVTGQHAAVWQDATGTDRFAGTPRATPFSVDQNAGLLEFTPHNREFVNQLTTWEGGAVVISQPDGAVVATDPSFTIDGTTSTGVLRWTLVKLTGSGSLGGESQATATATHAATSDILLVAPSATFTITSPEASAWRLFFSDRVLAGGATGSAVAGGSGSTATLALGGGSVTSWVIRLHIVEASVTVT